MKKNVLRCLILFLLLLAVCALLGIGLLTLTEYRPKETETIVADHAVSPVLKAGAPLTALSWNCGYGALGDNADFFMDGGSSVYTADKPRVMQNLQGLHSVLSSLDPDFVLLQEVDRNSSRSYGTDECLFLREGLHAGFEAFAYNFNALYVPYPLPPIGHVESGLYTLSSAEIRTAERLSLPCPFSWPIRTVNLKRCLLVSRIPVEGQERELVLVNLHLEAYDSGEGKEAQMRQLADFMHAEYDKGNYVIAGGDFNHHFSQVDLSAYPTFPGLWQPGHTGFDAFGEHFSLCMDPSVPTCRSLDRAFAGEDPEGFQFYMIDDFIVSDNVQVDSLQTLQEGFSCSDHNPVLMHFTLL